MANNNKDKAFRNIDKEDYKVIEIYCRSIDDDIEKVELKNFFKEFDNLKITRRNKRFLVHFELYGSFTDYFKKYCDLLLSKKTLKHEGNFEIYVYSKGLQIDGRNSSLTLRLFNFESSPVSIRYYNNEKAEDGFYNLNDRCAYMEILNILSTREYDEENKEIALINEFIEFTRQKIKESRKVGAEDLVYKFLIEIKNLKQMIIEIKAKTENKVIYLNYKNQLLLNYRDDDTIKKIVRVENKIETTRDKIETMKKENGILGSCRNFIESKKRKIKRTFTDKNYIDYLTKSDYFKVEIYHNIYYRMPIAESEIIKLKNYREQLIKGVNL